MPRRRPLAYALALCLACGCAAYGMLPAPRAPPSAGRAQRTTRRQHLFGVAGLAGVAAMSPSIGAAHADDASAASRKWMSGRSDPIRKTSKDKSDGTKKDPKYLSCLNDCIPRCLGPPGSEQKDRLECLEQCQDDCCFTYQQCTYRVRQ